MWRSTAGREQWRQVRAAATADLPEAKPPKILPETHFAAASLFESQGLIDKAIKQYRRAIAVNHQYVEAYHRLALLLSVTGRRAEALQAFHRAVDLRPDNAVLRNNLGFELLLGRRWEEARRELARAIDLNPGLSRAFVNLGIVQSHLGRFYEALAAFQAVLPESDAYYNLSLMYRGQHRYEEAAEALRHALSIDPNFSAAKTRLEQLASRLNPETFPAILPPQRSDVTSSDDQVIDWTTYAQAVEATVEPEPASDLSSPAQSPEEEAASWDDAFAMLDTMMAVDVAESFETPDFPSDAQPREEFLLVDALDVFDAIERLTDASFEDVEETIESFQEGEWEFSPYAEWDESVSYADVIVKGEHGYASVDHATPARTAEEFTEVSMSVVVEHFPIEQSVEAASSFNYWGVLDELEEQLQVVRNEIQCPDLFDTESVETFAAAEHGHASVDHATPGQPWVAPAPLGGKSEPFRSLAFPSLRRFVTDQIMGPPAELATIPYELRTRVPAWQQVWPAARLVTDVNDAASAARSRRDKQSAKSGEGEVFKPATGGKAKAQTRQRAKPSKPGRISTPLSHTGIVPAMWRTTGWQATFDIDADLFALAWHGPRLRAHAFPWVASSTLAWPCFPFIETTIDQAPTIDNRVTRLSPPTDPYNEVRGTFGHHFAGLQD